MFTHFSSLDKDRKAKTFEMSTWRLFSRENMSSVFPGISVHAFIFGIKQTKSHLFTSGKTIQCLWLCFVRSITHRRIKTSVSDVEVGFRC